MPDVELTGRAERPCVLLVEDDGDDRQKYAGILEQYATVVTAAGDDDALVVARRASLDAILVDVRRGDANDWNICARLKEQPGTRDVPLIVLTASEQGEAIDAARDVGASAILAKPCSAEQLVRAVDAVIRSNRVVDDQTSAAGRQTPFVLIVDTNASAIAPLRAGLSAAGYEVTAAPTFIEGMRVLRAAKPDVIVAALRLGEYNGLHFVAVTEGHLPAIIMGAGAYEAKEARGMGAEFLEQPVDAAALLGVVQRLAPLTPLHSPVRRWTRKRVTRSVPALVGASRAHIRDVSYGGLCLAIDAENEAIPPSVDITFPDVRQTVHAHVVWSDRTDDRTWLCGAQIPILTNAWQNLVDAIS